MMPRRCCYGGPPASLFLAAVVVAVVVGQAAALPTTFISTDYGLNNVDKDSNQVQPSVYSLQHHPYTNYPMVQQQLAATGQQLPSPTQLPGVMQHLTYQTQQLADPTQQLTYQNQQLTDPKQQLPFETQQLTDPTQQLTYQNQQQTGLKQKLPYETQQIADPTQQLTYQNQQLTDPNQKLMYQTQQLEDPTQQLTYQHQQLTDPRQQAYQNQYLSDPRQQAYQNQLISSQSPQLLYQGQQLSNAMQQLTNPSQQLTDQRQQLTYPWQQLTSQSQQLTDQNAQLTDKRLQQINTLQHLTDQQQQLMYETQQLTNPGQQQKYQVQQLPHPLLAMYPQQQQLQPIQQLPHPLAAMYPKQQQLHPVQQLMDQLTQPIIHSTTQSMNSMLQPIDERHLTHLTEQLMNPTQHLTGLSLQTMDPRQQIMQLTQQLLGSTQHITDHRSEPALPYCFKPDGLFPHPTKCGLFISCANGRGCIMECPATLHFNTDLLICMFPAQARCTPAFNVDVSSWPLPRTCREIASGQPIRPHHSPTTPAPPTTTAWPFTPTTEKPCTCSQDVHTGDPNISVGNGAIVSPVTSATIEASPEIISVPVSGDPDAPGPDGTVSVSGGETIDSVTPDKGQIDTGSSVEITNSSISGTDGSPGDVKPIEGIIEGIIEISIAEKPDSIIENADSESPDDNNVVGTDSDITGSGDTSIPISTEESSPGSAGPDNVDNSDVDSGSNGGINAYPGVDSGTNGGINTYPGVDSGTNGGINTYPGVDSGTNGGNSQPDKEGYVEIIHITEISQPGTTDTDTSNGESDSTEETNDVESPTDVNTISVPPISGDSLTSEDSDPDTISVPPISGDSPTSEDSDPENGDSATSSTVVDINAGQNGNLSPDKESESGGDIGRPIYPDSTIPGSLPPGPDPDIVPDSNESPTSINGESDLSGGSVTPSSQTDSEQVGEGGPGGSNIPGNGTTNDKPGANGEDSTVSSDGGGVDISAGFVDGCAEKGGSNCCLQFIENMAMDPGLYSVIKNYFIAKNRINNNNEGYNSFRQVPQTNFHYNANTHEEHNLRTVNTWEEEPLITSNTDVSRNAFIQNEGVTYQSQPTFDHFKQHEPLHI